MTDLSELQHKADVRNTDFVFEFKELLHSR